MKSMQAAHGIRSQIKPRSSLLWPWDGDSVTIGWVFYSGKGLIWVAPSQAVWGLQKVARGYQCGSSFSEWLVDASLGVWDEHSLLQAWDATLHPENTWLGLRGQLATLSSRSFLLMSGDHSTVADQLGNWPTWIPFLNVLFSVRQKE